MASDGEGVLLVWKSIDGRLLSSGGTFLLAFASCSHFLFSSAPSLRITWVVTTSSQEAEQRCRRDASATEILSTLYPGRLQPLTLATVEASKMLEARLPHRVKPGARCVGGVSSNHRRKPHPLLSPMWFSSTVPTKAA